MNKYVILLSCAILGVSGHVSSAADERVSAIISEPGAINYPEETRIYRDRLPTLVAQLPFEGSSEKTIEQINTRNDISAAFKEIIELEIKSMFLLETENFKEAIQNLKNESNISDIFQKEDCIRELKQEYYKLENENSEELCVFNSLIIEEYQILERKIPGINTYQPFRDIGAHYFSHRGGPTTYEYQFRDRPKLPDGISIEEKEILLQEFDKATIDFNAFIKNKKEQTTGHLENVFKLDGSIIGYEEELKECKKPLEILESLKSFNDSIVMLYKTFENRIPGINTYPPFRRIGESYFDSSSHARGASHQQVDSTADERARTQWKANLEQQYGIVKEEGGFPAARSWGIDPIGSAWRYARKIS